MFATNFLMIFSTLPCVVVVVVDPSRPNKLSLKNPSLGLLLELVDLLLGESLVLLGNLVGLEEDGLQHGVEPSCSAEDSKEENESKLQGARGAKRREKDR